MDQSTEPAEPPKTPDEKKEASQPNGDHVQQENDSPVVVSAQKSSSAVKQIYDEEKKEDLPAPSSNF